MQPVLNYRLQHTITECYSEDLGLKYFLVRLLAHNRGKTKQKPDNLLIFFFLNQLALGVFEKNSTSEYVSSHKKQVFHSNSRPQPSLKCKIPLQYATWVFQDKYKDTLVKILQTLKDDN